MSNSIFAKVMIGGVDVTSSIMPVLVCLDTFDGDEAESDSASLVLMDPEGQTIMPQKRDTVQIVLGRSGTGSGLVFEGFVDEARSVGDATGGRQIAIECTSVDFEGPAKSPGEKYWDDKDLKTIITDALSETGVSAEIDPSLLSIKRKYEAMDGRDPLTFVADLAREAGASFKMMGQKAVVVKRNTGLGLAGAMPTILAVAGDNLIAWDISPAVPRASFGDHISRWFDFDKANWQEEKQSGEGGAGLLNNAQRADQGLAKDTADASKTDTARKGGDGNVTIRGDHQAQAGGRIIVQGARPGIDGSYIIVSASHIVDADSGYLTECEVKKPDGGAGVDAR